MVAPNLNQSFANKAEEGFSAVMARMAQTAAPTLLSQVDTVSQILNDGASSAAFHAFDTNTTSQIGLMMRNSDAYNVGLSLSNAATQTKKNDDEATEFTDAMQRIQEAYEQAYADAQAFLDEAEPFYNNAMAETQQMIDELEPKVDEIKQNSEVIRVNGKVVVVNAQGQYVTLDAEGNQQSIITDEDELKEIEKQKNQIEDGGKQVRSAIDHSSVLLLQNLQIHLANLASGQLNIQNLRQQMRSGHYSENPSELPDDHNAARIQVDDDRAAQARLKQQFKNHTADNSLNKSQEHINREDAQYQALQGDGNELKKEAFLSKMSNNRVAKQNPATTVQGAESLSAKKSENPFRNPNEEHTAVAFDKTNSFKKGGANPFAGVTKTSPKFNTASAGQITDTPEVAQNNPFEKATKLPDTIAPGLLQS